MIDVFSPTAARKLIARRSGQVCELCGRRRATNVQHRKPTGQGGDWFLSNTLHVCGSGNAVGCHGEIHQHPSRAYANGWSVREALEPADIPALLMTDYGHQFVWLRDDGEKYLVDLATPVRALLERNEK